MPHVLKHLYDEDVLEEDSIAKWYKAKSKGEVAKVKESAKVFVEWLQYVSFFLFYPSSNVILGMLRRSLVKKRTSNSAIVYRFYCFSNK